MKTLYNSTHIFVFYDVKDTTIVNRATLPTSTDDFANDAAEFYFIAGGGGAGMPGLHRTYVYLII